MNDLLGKQSIEFQLTKTYNVFNRRLFKIGDQFPKLLPPTLHIKVGIGGKIIELFDKFMEICSQHRRNIERNRKHLAYCLSKIGDSRKSTTPFFFQILNLKLYSKEWTISVK